MAIQTLNIKHVRNIEEQQLLFSPGFNQVCGTNGSGKTSLLEAIAIIGRGRSFRSARAGSVISRGEKCLQVFAQVAAGDNIHRVGIEKRPSKTLVKINGTGVTRLSQLARLTPIQILTPRSHEIIERGPEYRRRFLDWGVFHVEHRYQTAIARYQKVLNQRNAAIRQRVNFGPGWDIELASAGEEVDQFRQVYLDHFSEIFYTCCSSFFPPGAITLEFKRGWHNGESLADTLKSHLERDRERGFTQVGPHRADLEIRFQGQLASHTASRGQQKLLIGLLNLAQSKLCRQLMSTSPIILLDDLASELDQDNQQKLLSSMLDSKSQIFITGTQRLSLNAREEKMFHVEHGRFIES